MTKISDLPETTSVAASDYLIVSQPNEITGTPITRKARVAYVQASSVVSVNGKTGTVVLNPDDLSDASTTNKFVTAADITKLGNLSGTNTGDQTTITGNAGTATALQNARTIGGVSFNGTANIVPQTIQTVDDAADTTCFILFGNASGTQSQQPKTNTALTFNASTGALAATSFTGSVAASALTGTSIPAAIVSSSLTSLGTLNSLTVTNTATVGSIDLTSTTVPANGIFSPAANFLGFSVNSVEELRLGGTAFFPNTNDGNALGTSTKAWADLFLATGGVIDFGAGNVTLTHSAGALTLAGTLALGTNNLTMTGSLGATGARLTKVWTASLESTTVPTVNGANVYYTGGTDVAVADGGTNISSYTTGDTLYASGTTTLSKLPIGSTGQVLGVSGGVPAWQASGIQLQTAIAATSGTSINLSTAVPATAKRITINFIGVSTNGTSMPLVQVGNGSFVTSGYLGGTTSSSVPGANQVITTLYTNGFNIAASGVVAATQVRHGKIVLDLADSATNTWTATGIIALSDAAVVSTIGGSIALAGALDRVRLTTAGGVDTFDAGTVSISWEF